MENTSIEFLETAGHILFIALLTLFGIVVIWVLWIFISIVPKVKREIEDENKDSYLAKQE